ncbi:MAG TPA: toll/interleukin-1 receptor domain-containing protein [Actinophytocola sp.]|uniref:toll/interleukin-1 receptor domain-containing protein n=1 Tax=Actinophytocola sp. TaxID=1872138 RepID=UPI002DBE1D97|nr:toll/interleukin-1 receptor domain-containing protein [Actinophytocola sp.]HEU5473714.1 toll/interleukin-1 receptor domain-containing protein [Actinophytocola sp.]
MFISYARADEGDRARLAAHLAPMVREGLIELWHDRVMEAGADWASTIERRLNTADIVVLLVSADFVASIFCFERELTDALRRHQDDGVRLLPVIVKPVDFANLPFARFHALPSNIVPVSLWSDVDSAWLDVAQGIRRVVTEMHASQTFLPAPRTPAASEKSSLGQQLADYYGPNSCVIDGALVDDGRIEWVPLDGNSANMRFGNLLPLNRRHRVRPLRGASGPMERTGFRFGFALTAEHLLHRSRQHFHEGSPALAFGCARLGDALSVRYPDVFATREADGWNLLSLCLAYLPYRIHGALLEATLQRVRYRLAHPVDCPDDYCAALLLAVANLYQDIGCWARAERLYEHVLRARPTAITEAAVLRRRTIGQFFTGSDDRQIGESFRRIAEYKTGVEFRVSVAIAHGWWQLLRDRPEECLQLLEPFDFDDEVEASVYSPHIAFELKLTQASALDFLGLSCRPQLDLVRRLTGRWSRTGLRPVFTNQIAPTVLAPQAAALIEPLSSAMAPTTALFAELDATATALLAARG